MPLCALCGGRLSKPEMFAGFCSWHSYVPANEDDWSFGNRLMCDFFHRGVIPKARCTCRVKRQSYHGEECFLFRDEPLLLEIRLRAIRANRRG